MTTETVLLSQCAEGDIILTHGEFFQLETQRVPTDDPDYARGLRSWATKHVASLLHVVIDGEPGDRRIPRGGLQHGWTIQSNDLARWSRVTSM